ncbi:transposase [Corynebacterium diphtheriae]|nr:transposase [Corynebacterium diphtheriae]
MTTRQSKGPDLRPDLVNCEFRALGSHRLWVADITYVRTRTRLCVHRVPDRCVLLEDHRVGVV